MLQKSLRVELDLARGSAEAPRRAIGVKFRVFGVAGFERQPNSAGIGAQLLEADAGRRQLAAVGGVDIAIPELRIEAKSLGNHPVAAAVLQTGFGRGWQAVVQATVLA